MEVIEYLGKINNIEDWEKEAINSLKDIEEKVDIPLLFIPVWGLYHSDFVWEKDIEKWLKDRFQNVIGSSFSANLAFAYLYFVKAKVNEAIPYFTKCASLRPKEFSLYYFLGICYFKNDDLRKGLECLETGITFCPDEFKHLFYYLIGALLLNNGDIDEAIVNLQNAIKFSNKKNALSINLSAFRLNRQIIEGHYHFTLALSYWRDYNLPLAKQEFLKAAERFKGDKEAGEVGLFAEATHLCMLMDFEISYYNAIKESSEFDEFERKMRRVNTRFNKYYYGSWVGDKGKSQAERRRAGVIKDIIRFASGKDHDFRTVSNVYEFSLRETLFFAKWFYYQSLIIFFDSQKIIHFENLDNLRTVLDKFGFIREQHAIDSIDDFLKGLQTEVAQYKSISNIPKDRQVILLDRLKNCFEFAMKPTFIEPSKVPPDKESKHVKELLESIDNKTSIIIETAKDESLIDDLPPWLKIPYKVFKKILKIKTKNERLFWEVLIALILLAIFLIGYFPHLISLKEMIFNLIKSLAKRLQITL